MRPTDAPHNKFKELGEEGVRAVLAAADAFAIESKQSTESKRNMADEHLLKEQRFYNSLCMIYGSDPAKYANIVNDGYSAQRTCRPVPGGISKSRR